MKLVMTLLVRDEEDIVDANVRFHLERGVDLVLVTDNLSLDRTRDLLADFERQGAVRVWSEPNDEYRQWEWVSRMAQAAAAGFGADWVLHSDADEFWWTDTPLPELLAAVPPHHDVVTAPRQDFLPLRGETGVPFFERMTVRDTRARNILGRRLLPKCAHRAADDVIVAQGNHFVVNDDMTLAPDPLDALILHFPIRDYAQLERKVVLGGRAYARNHDMPETVGNTWRVLYRAYLDGRLKDYFDGLLPDEAALAAGMGTGRYVVDTRLRNVLARQPRAFAHLADPAAFGTHGDDYTRGGRAAGAVVAAAQACCHEAGMRRVAGNVKEQLVAFIDDARSSLDVVSGSLSACGVLAALAGARQRGVALRLLTVDPAPSRSWQLHVMLRRIPREHPETALVRDGVDVWRGPTSLDERGLHHAAPSAQVVLGSSGASTLRRHVDSLWAQAGQVASIDMALAAGGWS